MIEASKLPDSPLRKTIGIAQPIHSTKSVWKRAFELRALGGQIVCTCVFLFSVSGVGNNSPAFA
jgi:hypothetical protein